MHDNHSRRVSTCGKKCVCKKMCISLCAYEMHDACVFDASHEIGSVSVLTTFTGRCSACKCVHALCSQHTLARQKGHTHVFDSYSSASASNALASSSTYGLSSTRQ